jgi:hypothetical protein
MSAIGIPSFVTQGGLDTWPEFLINSLIVEVDWSNLTEVAHKILEMNEKSISNFDLDQAKKIIDIQNHVNQMMQILNQTL